MVSTRAKTKLATDVHQQAAQPASLAEWKPSPSQKIAIVRNAHTMQTTRWLRNISGSGGLGLTFGRSELAALCEYRTRYACPVRMTAIPVQMPRTKAQPTHALFGRRCTVIPEAYPVLATGATRSQRLTCDRASLHHRRRTRQTLNVSATAGFVTLPWRMLTPWASAGFSRDRLVAALLGQLQHVGQRHVGQRVGAGAADGAGHVGHAVVHDVVDDVRRARCASSAGWSRRSRPGRWPRR